VYVVAQSRPVRRHELRHTPLNRLGQSTQRAGAPSLLHTTELATHPLFPHSPTTRREIGFTSASSTNTRLRLLRHIGRLHGDTRSSPHRSSGTGRRHVPRTVEHVRRRRSQGDGRESHERKLGIHTGTVLLDAQRSGGGWTAGARELTICAAATLCCRLPIYRHLVAAPLLIQPLQDVCDKVGSSDTGAKDAVAAMIKRLAHRNANVQLYTLELANALSQNCGMQMHKELASRSFTDAMLRLASDRNTHQAVKAKILERMAEWTDMFARDPDLGIMEGAYMKLKSQSEFQRCMLSHES
jgi:hypothetical protein